MSNGRDHHEYTKPMSTHGYTRVILPMGVVPMSMGTHTTWVQMSMGIDIWFDGYTHEYTHDLDCVYIHADFNDMPHYL